MPPRAPQAGSTRPPSPSGDEPHAQPDLDPEAGQGGPAQPSPAERRPGGGPGGPRPAEGPGEWRVGQRPGAEPAEAGATDPDPTEAASLAEAALAAGEAGALPPRYGQEETVTGPAAGPPGHQVPGWRGKGGQGLESAVSKSAARNLKSFCIYKRF